MRRNAARIGILFFYATLLVHAREARGWVQASTTTSWGTVDFHHEGNCVAWALNRRGSDDVDDFELVHQAAARAFATWNAVGCSHIKFYETPVSRCGCKQIGYNQGGRNVNLIVWFEEYWPSNYPPNAVGLTIVSYEDATGEIVDADIAMNGSSYTFGIVDPHDCEGLSDIQDTLTHEAGHMLGFDESDVRGATMWPFTHTCDIEKRTLSEDDIEGLCAMYPLDNDPLVCKSPDGGLETCEGCSCSAASAAGMREASSIALFAWSLLFLVVLIGRKRRVAS
jgi:hypothetical protein